MSSKWFEILRKIIDDNMKAFENGGEEHKPEINRRALIDLIKKKHSGGAARVNADTKGIKLLIKLIRQGKCECPQGECERPDWAEVKDGKITISNVNFAEELNLEYAKSALAIEFENCAFEKEVKLSYAEIPKLTLNQVYVQKKMELIEIRAQRLSIGKESVFIEGVDMHRAQIGAAVFSRCLVIGKIREDSDYLDLLALEANDIQVSGSFYLADDFLAYGRVDMLRAKIKGRLSFSKGVFIAATDTPNTDTPKLDPKKTEATSIDARGAKIEGSVVMGIPEGEEYEHRHGSEVDAERTKNKEMFIAVGRIRMELAEIKGTLFCQYGTFCRKPDADFHDHKDHKEKLLSLDIVHANIGGSVDTRRARFYGRLRLENARIGGNWGCKGSSFDFAHKGKENRIAIGAHNVKVEGSVLFNGDFRSTGSVCMAGAEIGGRWCCEGETGRTGDGHDKAIYADGIKVGSDLIFMNFKAVGIVQMPNAEIRGKAQFGEKEKTCEVDVLQIQGAKIGGDFKIEAYSGDEIIAKGLRVYASGYIQECTNMNNIKIKMDLSELKGNMHIRNIEEVAQIDMSQSHIKGELEMKDIVSREGKNTSRREKDRRKSERDGKEYKENRRKDDRRKKVRRKSDKEDGETRKGLIKMEAIIISSGARIAEVRAGKITLRYSSIEYINFYGGGEIELLDLELVNADYIGFHNTSSVPDWNNKGEININKVNAKTMNVKSDMGIYSVAKNCEEIDLAQTRIKGVFKINSSILENNKTINLSGVRYNFFKIRRSPTEKNDNDDEIFFKWVENNRAIQREINDPHLCNQVVLAVSREGKEDKARYFLYRILSGPRRIGIWKTIRLAIYALVLFSFIFYNVEDIPKPIIIIILIAMIAEIAEIVGVAGLVKPRIKRHIKKLLVRIARLVKPRIRIILQHVWRYIRNLLILVPLFSLPGDWFHIIVYLVYVFLLVKFEVPRKIAAYFYAFLTPSVLTSILIIAIGSYIYGDAETDGRMIPAPVVVASVKYPEHKENIMSEYTTFHPLFYSIDVFVPLFFLGQEKYWYINPCRDDEAANKEKISKYSSESDLLSWMSLKCGSGEKAITMDIKGKILFVFHFYQIIMGWLLTSTIVLHMTRLRRITARPANST